MHNTLPLDAVLARIRETFTVHFEPMKIDEEHFEVLSIDNMRKYLDALLHAHALHNPLTDLPLWAKVWPGSLVLGRLLRKYAPENKTLLELGCGCGIVSLIASRLPFAHIDATDVNQQALLFARANILQNKSEAKVSVATLDLKQPAPSHAQWPVYDIVAASEILYLPELHTPILKFLDTHLKPQGVALFCTDYARRQKDFLRKAKKQYFCTQGHIGIKTAHDSGDTERHIYEITILSKQESTHSTQ